jgi:chemotaxis protein MotB
MSSGGGSGNGRRRRRDIGGKANHERWMISYADMLTLLLAVFIVLWSTSRENISKINAAAASMLQAFTGQPPALIEMPAAPHGPMHNLPKPVARPIEAPAPLRKSIPTIRNKLAPALQKPILPHNEQVKLHASIAALNRLELNLEHLLRPEIVKNQIKILAKPLSFKIRLNAKVLFHSGHARLTKNADALLTPVGQVLSQVPPGYLITIQGYTDISPIHTAKYPSNWQLSTARAMSVLLLFRKDHVSGNALSAQGFGQYQAIAPNNTATGRALNRRVEILITAPKPRHPGQDAGPKPASTQAIEKDHASNEKPQSTGQAGPRTP